MELGRHRIRYITLRVVACKRKQVVHMLRRAYRAQAGEAARRMLGPVCAQLGIPVPASRQERRSLLRHLPALVACSQLLVLQPSWLAEELGRPHPPGPTPGGPAGPVGSLKWQIARLTLLRLPRQALPRRLQEAIVQGAQATVELLAQPLLHCAGGVGDS